MTNVWLKIEPLTESEDRIRKGDWVRAEGLGEGLVVEICNSDADMSEGRYYPIQGKLVILFEANHYHDEYLDSAYMSDCELLIQECDKCGGEGFVEVHPNRDPQIVEVIRCNRCNDDEPTF